jgi:Tol biopolymer transport system component
LWRRRPVVLPDPYPTAAAAEQPQLPFESSPITARVNVSTVGGQARGSTYGAALSADGRFVAFASAANTLVPNDRNGQIDVFVRDLLTSRTTRVSVSSAGAESNGASGKPSISADGHIVAFPSNATNLVRGDTNGTQDIFVRDLSSGTTRRVSIGTAGESNGSSLAPVVSADGRMVAFSSDASNLVPDDKNGTMDVFVADLLRRRTIRVSVGRHGESHGRSEVSSITAHGAIVAFRSFAPNLVPGDTNGLADVFVRTWRTGATERVNVSSAGAQANGVTFRGNLSANGRFVGFRSRADNLVPDDTNDALDVFVVDIATHHTRRISVSTDGAEADARRVHEYVRDNKFASRPFLSADGRYAAFTSRAANLVPADGNGLPDVFVYDLRTGRTVRVSTPRQGRDANGASLVSGITADGQLVLFQSFANNLVPRDTNGRKDVFVRRWNVEREIHNAHARASD